MDWTENQQCVLCDDGGGNLLVCNDDGCPISVHQSCMRCEPHFDDAGNFHCPYCVYKQCTAEASRLRSNVMLTKKALSGFLEAEMRDENHCEPVVDMANKDKSVDEKTNEGSNANTCKMMVVYESRMKVDQEEKSKCEKITSEARNKSVMLNVNGRKTDPVMEHGAKTEFKQLSMINRNKRGRVLWSEQEEEMLKEGVQKYSTLTKKNLPWRKILEFGRHVFDSSRTPSDLKDKWRKIAK